MTAAAQHTPGPARYWVVAKDHPHKLEGSLLGYVVREDGGWSLSRPWLKEQRGAVCPTPEDAVRHLKHVQLEAEDLPSEPAVCTQALTSDQLRRIRACLERGVATGVITKSEAYACAAIARAAGLDVHSEGRVLVVQPSSSRAKATGDAA